MAADLRRVKELFVAALEVPAGEARVDFLLQACGEDAELRERVEVLLAAHDVPVSALDKPLAGEAAPLQPTIASERPPQDLAGTLVGGRYKLLEQIGEGGMGAVWVAEQTEPVKRRVALKLIKPGMDTKQVLSRFEAERQALALMDHPNIARVFDGGMTDEGRPFFVMEYVKGVPITDYCDQARLSIAERLGLFMRVCQAVQHAHQKGIIHRDLKPSNILVCLYDGQPVPKVIDFGLAKAMNQPLTERTVYTAHGLMVGTPLYMSPEQAEFNNLDVDTRTDVYSLGVLLYELLTGSTPLEQRKFKDAAFAEILRLIKEEEPTRPSLKLSGSASLPSIAAQRNVEPAQLSRTVRGDLDWIVMKSLEKERSRRYETANGLARDIERHLRDEPVEACPPTLRYRLGKVLRKHHTSVMTGVMVATLMVIATLASAWQSHRAAHAEQRAVIQAQMAQQARDAEVKQRQRADAEAAAARAVRDFLQNDLLRQASLQHQVEVNSMFQDGSKFLQNPTINELLDRAAAQLAPDKIEAKFPKLPAVQAEVLKAVGDAYAGASPAKAIEPLQRAIELYQHARGSDDSRTLAARHSLGVALFANRQNTEAEKQLAAVCADRTRVLGPVHADTFATRDFLGRIYLSTKDARGIAYFEQLQADLEKHFGADHIETLKARFHKGCALADAGRFDDGIREMEAVGAAGERQGMRTDHPYLFTGAFEGGLAYKAKGDHAKAITYFEKCLQIAEEHHLPARAHWDVRHQLGWCYLGAGRREDAIATFEKNLEFAKPPEDAVSLEALGWATRQVDIDRSLSLYQQARDLRTQRSGADDPEALRVGYKQASLMREFGKTGEALELWDELLPRLEKVHGPEHLTVFKGLLEKGRCLSALKQSEAADVLFRDAIARMEQQSGIKKTDILEGRREWMLAIQERGDYLRTAEMARELAAQWRAADHSQPVRLADVLLAQGSNFVKAGRPGDGESAIREAVAIYTKTTPQSWTIANARQWHGAALQEQDKLAEAEPLLVTAFSEMTERLDQMPRWGKNHRQDVAQRLVVLYTAQDKPDEAAKWQQQLDALRAETASVKE